MPCETFGGAIVCSHTVISVYVCLEHTTYLMEFSPQFGPAWFRMPNEEYVTPDPDGHLSFLWDIFEEWYEAWKGPDVVQADVN